MGFFRTQEEKEAQRLLEEKIANLDRFPGNLAEYNNFKGQEYVIIDTERPNKFVREDRDSDLLARLVEQGCEALIYYNLNQGNTLENPYGTPVKKKPAQ